MQMFTATTIHLFKMLNHFFTPVSSFFILFWQMQSTKMQQVPDTIFTSGLIVDYLLAGARQCTGMFPRYCWYINTFCFAALHIITQFSSVYLILLLLLLFICCWYISRIYYVTNSSQAA